MVMALPLLIEFAATGEVTRLPTAILCTGVMIISMLIVTAGVILDSIRRFRAETKRMFYNQVQPWMAKS